MSAPLDITVSVNGGIFKRDIRRTARQAVYEEALQKIDQRLMRRGIYGSGGKGRGVRRNIVEHARDDDLAIEVSSTLRWPRTKGTTWTKKNVAIVKAMAPRVLRKAADRIVQEMG